MKISRVLTLVVLVPTAWVFFEWLFFVTKPSFLTLYSGWERFGILSSSALIMSLSLLLVTLPFAAVAMLLKRSGVSRAIVHTIALLPAIVLLGMAMMVMVDNFTLTLFGYGIRDTAGPMVYVYRVGTVLLLLLSARLLIGSLRRRSATGALKTLAVTAGLILVASLPFLAVSFAELRTDTQYSVKSGERLPNIIILSGDGIAARHMSVYGYERQTTPFLERIADEFLVAENHFSNAADTGGAVIAMLTGKLPTTTRVVYPPDVLRGRDSFQHLPGILKSLGYHTADVSMRHYADPYDLNLRGGFDEANFRALKESGGTLVAAIRSVPALTPASLLIDRISERIAERFEHVWKGKQMQDPMAEVNVPDLRWVTDDERVEVIQRFIAEAPRPFFLNVHTMGTHGNVFKPSRRVYSTEADRKVIWSIDAYDDAIIDFDRHTEEIYGLLQERGLLEDTIFVISSDHGFRHNPLDRLPLMMRLPGKQRTGSLGENTQRIDIAPTLLDVLDRDVPAWMEGRSMLAPLDTNSPERPVFATQSHGDKAADGNFWHVVTHDPPWYSMGRIFLVYCDQGFYVKLKDMEVAGGRIAGSTRSCEDRLSTEEARAMMLDHLREQGYRWE
jgi:arylsulfatase A-like enzyme